MTGTTQQGPIFTSPPTEYRVSVAAPAGGAAIAKVGSTSVELDTTWGQPASGSPGPAELLAGAFAACLLKNLARTHDLRGFQYDDAQVEVLAKRQDSPPRFVQITYTLTVRTNETQQRIDLVHKNLRKYGTVYNTLAAVCDVDGQMVAALEPRASSS